MAVEPGVRVSTLELFFDLVFVFTITQLTGVLANDLTVPGALRVLLMLGVIWWMYDGYAWLTNAVAPVSRIRRGLLVTGMAGFLVIALAIPDAFGATGWAFGLGYFLVNAVHSGLFIYTAGERGAAAMRALARFNLLSAGLLLVGGFVPTPARYVVWGAAFVVQWFSPYLSPPAGFSISPAHFVERHGLVVIVALGESIVALGAGAFGLDLNLGLILVAVLALVLSYFLWWTYFGGDDERAEHRLAAEEDATRRAWLALYAYGYAHYALLFGVVAFAAGVKKAIGHAFDHLATPEALVLGGGVAVFLAADVTFRRVLGLAPTGVRAVGALAALATVPIGVLMASAQLAALALVVLAALVVEEWRSRRGATEATLGPP
ncbi:MAG TPA: low temperature requirement protein A [Micromonosporaceae bacterium]|nr:low temperature requirement protein A [Micromonosporaceae bacterium]